MSPLTEIRLVVQRELRKNFRSAKGIVLAVLSLLGGGSVALLLVKYQEFKRQELGELSPEQIHDLREKALTKIYDPAMAKSLADSPEVLLALLGLTIWLTPMLVALMGFDSVSPDIQHRTVRYWTLRTRRWSRTTARCAGPMSAATTAISNSRTWARSPVSPGSSRASASRSRPSPKPATPAPSSQPRVRAT